MSASGDVCIDLSQLLTVSDNEDTGDIEPEERPVMCAGEYEDMQSEDGDEDEEDDDVGDVVNTQWSDNIVPHNHFSFDYSASEVNQQLLTSCREPIEFYELFMDGIWDLIVTETNRYAQEKEKLWRPTTVEEVKRFIGLCLQMGIVQLPKLTDYWNPSRVFGTNSIGNQVMPKYRFEQLLFHLHLAENATFDGEDELYKIRPLIQLFNRNSRRIYTPGKEVCIDESHVHFKAKSSFNQNIPNKKQKFGIKIFKLCCKGGYTYKIVVHANEDLARISTVSESVVMELLDELLDKGRHLFTDTPYTSVSLAEALIKRKTHLIGKIRIDGKDLPKQVINQKLKRGELSAQQNPKGIMVLKWRGKKDMIMLSTVHNASFCADSSKPEVVQSYNQGKLFLDKRDQMAFCFPLNNKANKWYKRLFFHLVTQTCMVNAWRTYCETIQEITITDFRMGVLLCLIPSGGLPVAAPLMSHILEVVPKIYRRCVGCYKTLTTIQDSKSAGIQSKRVNTRCNQCKRYFCINCFNNFHKT